MPGEIIVNLPGALYQGGNTGPNVAEAVNCAFFYDNWVHRSMFPTNCSCKQPLPISRAAWLRFTKWFEPWMAGNLHEVHPDSVPRPWLHLRVNDTSNTVKGRVEKVRPPDLNELLGLNERLRTLNMKRRIRELKKKRSSRKRAKVTTSPAKHLFLSHNLCGMRTDDLHLLVL